MANPFITPQDLIDYLGRGGTADPAMLIVTDAACDMVRDVAEQTFNEVIKDVAVLDGSGSNVIQLPQRPVTKAGTVVVNGGTVVDFVTRSDGMMFRTGGSIVTTSFLPWWEAWMPTDPFATTAQWPEGRANITVTYDHGYAADEIPRSVRMVALSLAARMAVQGPALQQTIGPTAIRYAVASTDLTENELRILRKYRR